MLHTHRSDSRLRAESLAQAAVWVSLSDTMHSPCEHFLDGTDLHKIVLSYVLDPLIMTTLCAVAPNWEGRCFDKTSWLDKVVRCAARVLQACRPRCVESLSKLDICKVYRHTSLDGSILRPTNGAIGVTMAVVEATTSAARHPGRNTQPRRARLEGHDVAALSRPVVTYRVGCASLRHTTASARIRGPSAQRVLRLDEHEGCLRAYHIDDKSILCVRFAGKLSACRLRPIEVSLLWNLRWPCLLLFEFAHLA